MDDNSLNISTDNDPLGILKPQAKAAPQPVAKQPAVNDPLGILKPTSKQPVPQPAVDDADPLNTKTANLRPLRPEDTEETIYHNPLRGAQASAIGSVAGIEHGLGDFLYQISNKKVQDDLRSLIEKQGNLFQSGNPADYDMLINLAKTERDNWVKKINDNQPTIPSVGFMPMGAMIKQPSNGVNSDAAKNISELDNFIKSVTEYKRLISTHSPKVVQKYLNEVVPKNPTRGERMMEEANRLNESAPKGEGFWFNFGSILGSVAPMVAGTIVSGLGAPQVGMPLIYGSIAGQTAAQYGSTLQELDNYAKEKGIKIDNDVRYAIPVASAAAEIAFE